MPGVTVTVQGTDIIRTFTTDAEGRYRFLELAPGDYTLTATLQGFSTNVRPRVIVGVGQTVELPVTLVIGALTETVNVTASSPMVDVRQTGTSTNVTIDELTNIPTSRDPFSLLRSINGVLVDRVNVGGNETGQQSSFVSKGTRPQDAVWTMDGVAITDMALRSSHLLQLRPSGDPRLDRGPIIPADWRAGSTCRQGGTACSRRAPTSTTDRWRRRTCPTS